MKKLIAVMLLLAMALSMAACGGETDPKGTDAPQQTNAPQVQGPASALEALQKIWELYGEEDAFFAMGGDMDHMVDGNPGSYDMSKKADLEYQLYIPADQLANVDEAATLIHGMNANTFTGAALHVTSDTAAFAKAARDAILGNQWMCGFPDKLVIADLGGGYVIVSFGQVMDVFEAKLKEAYPNANVLYSEPIV